MMVRYTALSPVVAFAAWLAGGEAARAACDPAAGSNVTATCTGTTVNQNAPHGYGTGVENNLNVTVVSGASVTGTNVGIFFNTGTVTNFGTIAGINQTASPPSLPTSSIPAPSPVIATASTLILLTSSISAPFRAATPASRLSTPPTSSISAPFRAAPAASSLSKPPPTSPISGPSLASTVSTPELPTSSISVPLRAATSASKLSTPPTSSIPAPFRGAPSASARRLGKPTSSIQEPSQAASRRFSLPALRTR
jgi:hypothetical protein